MGLEALKVFSPDVVIINAASLRTNGLRLVSWFHNSLPGTPLCLIVAEDEPVAETENVQFFLRLPFTVQKLNNRLRTLENNSHKGILTRGIWFLTLIAAWLCIAARKSGSRPAWQICWKK